MATSYFYDGLDSSTIEGNEIMKMNAKSFNSRYSTCGILCFLLFQQEVESFHTYSPGNWPLHHDGNRGQSCHPHNFRLPALQLQQNFAQQSRPNNNDNNRRRGRPPPEFQKAIERNKKIVALGKQMRVDDLFELFDRESKNFSHVNFATLLMQLQRMGRHGVRQNDPRLKDLLVEIGNHLQNPTTAPMWRPREICNVIYAMSKITDFRNTEAQTILDHVESIAVLTDIMTGESQTVSNILWAYATQGYVSPVVFEAAERHIDSIFEGGNPQEIANILWAFAKQRHDSRIVYRAAERHIAGVFEAGNSQSIANILWAYATQGYESPVVFATAERHIDRVFQLGTPQNIANTLWAFAKQGYESSSVFVAAERYIDHVMQRGNSQDISNTLWAFAKQDYVSPAIFESAERHIDRILKDGNPQAISNTIWAYATQGYNSPLVFSATERHIVRVFDDGNFQSIANILWAYATQGYESPVVFAAAERHIDRLFHGGNPQTVSNILWAFAKQGYDSHVVFRFAEGQIDRVFEDANPQEITNILWAYATQGYESHVVFRAAEGRIERMFEDGSSQTIANTLWAFAKQGYDSQDVFRAAERRIDRVFKDENPQHIANTLWAYASQGWMVAASNNFLLLWSKATSSKWDQFSDDEKRQLLGTYILTVPDLTLDVPQEWLEDSERLGRKNHETSWQQDVAAILNQIGFKHKFEVDPVPNIIPGYLAVDIACSESNIAIEVDGPSHYLCSLSQAEGLVPPAENGPTKAKRRLLTRLGWQVINISYLEWDNLASKASKKAYLSAMLAKAGGGESPVVETQNNSVAANGDQRHHWSSVEA